MMTDILSAYDWPKNNVASLYYDIADGPEDSPHPAPPKKQRKKEPLAIEDEKPNPYHGPEELVLKPTDNSNMLAANNHRYESVNFESMGVCSLFRKHNQNSNSFWACSNSFMGLAAFGREDTNNLDALRETIKLVESEEKPEDGFKAPPQ